MRAAMALDWIKRGSLYLLDDADFFQRLQVFDDEVQRHRTVLGRNGVANLLRVALAVGEVQRLVGVLFTGAPQSFVVKTLRPSTLRARMVVHKVVPEPGSGSFRRGLP